MSNLLDKASVILTPTAYNTSEALCVKPSDGTGDFDFSRATDATRINSLGLIETIGINLPRINYEGGCGSWLFEPQSTNHCTFSEQPSVWSSSNGVTITTNAETSPEGSLNASTVVNTSTRNANVKNEFIYTSSAATLDVTTSYFIKYTNNQWIFLRPTGFSGGTDAKTWFDIQNGVLGTNNNISSSIQDYGNGWYRCSITHQIAPATGTTGSVNILAVDNDNSSSQVIGQGFAAFGSQGEELSYATSYIPTSGSTVTRNQDLCTNGGSAASINSSEGVLYFEGSALLNGGGINRLISLSDGTNNNLIYLRIDSTASRFRGFARGSGGSYNIITVNGINQTNNNKVALVWDATDFKIYINGVFKTSATINNLPIEMNTIDFTSPTGGDIFFGNTKCVAVWKEALTDAELISLTTL
jgi:hypothetical protein